MGKKEKTVFKQLKDDYENGRDDLTHLNLVMTAGIYEDIKHYARKQGIAVGKAFDIAGRLLIDNFNKEIAEGLK